MLSFKDIKHKLRIKIQDTNKEKALDRWTNIGKKIFEISKEVGAVNVEDIKNSIFNDYIFEVHELTKEGKGIHYNYINVDEERDIIHLESSIYIKYNNELIGTYTVLGSVDFSFKEALEIVKGNKTILSNENNFATDNEKIFTTMQEEEKKAKALYKISKLVGVSNPYNMLKRIGQVSDMINGAIKYAIALHIHLNLLQKKREESVASINKTLYKNDYINSKTGYSPKDYKNIKDVIMNKKQINYDMIKDYIVSKRQYNKTTSRWIVRGHYRHYKSGKTVFVKSYEKGIKEHSLQLNHYIL